MNVQPSTGNFSSSPSAPVFQSGSRLPNARLFEQVEAQNISNIHFAEAAAMPPRATQNTGRHLERAGLGLAAGLLTGIAVSLGMILTRPGDFDLTKYTLATAGGAFLGATTAAALSVCGQACRNSRVPVAQEVPMLNVNIHQTIHATVIAPQLANV